MYACWSVSLSGLWTLQWPELFELDSGSCWIKKSSRYYYLLTDRCHIYQPVHWKLDAVVEKSNCNSEEFLILCKSLQCLVNIICNNLIVPTTYIYIYEDRLLNVTARVPLNYLRNTATHIPFTHQTTYWWGFEFATSLTYCQYSLLDYWNVAINWAVTKLCPKIKGDWSTRTLVIRIFRVSRIVSRLAKM